MYIRLKIFERKEESKLNTPLASYEVNGTHAIRLIIVYLLEFAYPKEIKDKIKNILEQMEN